MLILGIKGDSLSWTDSKLYFTTQGPQKETDFLQVVPQAAPATIQQTKTGPGGYFGEPVRVELVEEALRGVGFQLKHMFVDPDADETEVAEALADQVAEGAFTKQPIYARLILMALSWRW